MTSTLLDCERMFGSICLFSTGVAIIAHWHHNYFSVNDYTSLKAGEVLQQHSTKQN